jgi:electron transport complex protein RnfC
MDEMDYKIVSFRGGIHPKDDGKLLSSHEAVKPAPLLPEYKVVVHQSIGAPPKLLVQPGAEVKKGDKLAEPGGFVSSALHAPTSGKVDSIIDIPGPMGVPVSALRIVADGEDAWGELPPPLDWRSADPAELKKRIADSGIVGMGGAAFPTQVKLSPPPGQSIDYLILNGAECEPYLTADHRLMLENPDAVLAGAAICARIVGAKEVCVGVEINKTDAIQALLAKAAAYGVKVVGLKVRYPQGAEKQLIYAISGRRVPAGGLPAAAGCVVVNVATAAAVADAVERGLPLIERITSVTGEPVRHPGNWKFRIGTPIAKAIELAGGVTCEPGKFILGGPMMGFAQRSFDVTVMKNTSGILLLAPSQIEQYESTGCIRCGRCLAACSMNLNPSALGTAIESEKFDIAAANYVMDCIECGSCSYVCPAHRPLVQHIRRAKAEIRNRMKK